MSRNPWFTLYEREQFEAESNSIEGDSVVYAISIDIEGDKANVREDRLRGWHSIVEWISQANMEGSALQGGLRLIIAANPKKKHFERAKRQEHFHEDELSPELRVNTLDPSDQERIVDMFELPAPTAWDLSAEFSHFQRYDMVSPNRTGFSIRQASQGGLILNLGLGLSFDKERNITYGLLLGCQNTQAAFIATQLRELALLSIHPLLLPTMILGFERSFLGRKLQLTRLSMLDVEENSGQTTWPVVSHTQAAQMSLMEDGARDVDTRELSRNALGVVQSATVYQRLMEDLVVLLDAVAEAHEVFKKFVKGENDEFETAYAIDERLRFVRNKTLLMLPAIRGYKERSVAQISAIYNLIAERNNRINQELNFDSREMTAASRRDSSAMKTVAMLTMLFLPGTFVATVFAMPFFDFSASRGEDAISPIFWVYWAITIPLTATVLVFWVHKNGDEEHNWGNIPRGWNIMPSFGIHLRRAKARDSEKTE